MKNPNEVALLALDIGACKHAYAFEAAGRQQSGELRNEVAEIRRFVSAALKRHGSLRVLVEATGIYYLDLALIAHELGAQVMVVNPKAAHNFAKALQVRSKSDQIDAHTLLEFLKRMPFQAWTPPAAEILQLRYYGRHLTQLTDERTACLNRLHALQSTQASPQLLITDLEQAVAGLDQRIAHIRGTALALIHEQTQMQAIHEALTSIAGIADTSAVSVLAELLVLPTSMSARACTSHAGLDVRTYQSGHSVQRPARISKHGNKYLRRALFLPALSNARHDPHANQFKQRLLDRGKPKMQANVAIMRKLLTVCWAMVRNPQPYDGSKLYHTHKED